MSLIDSITSTILEKLTGDLPDHLADKFGLDVHEVEDEIRIYLGKTPVYPKEPKSLRKSDVEIKKPITGVRTCKFVHISGKNAGKKCTTEIRGVSDYCSKHKTRNAAKYGHSDHKYTYNPTVKCWLVSGTKFVVKYPHNKTVISKLIGNKKFKITENDREQIEKAGLNHNLQQPTNSAEEDIESSEEDDSIVESSESIKDIVESSESDNSSEEDTFEGFSDSESSE